jgi:hypothetical protein
MALDAVMLSGFIGCYAECHCAECRHDECRGSLYNVLSH